MSKLTFKVKHSRDFSIELSKAKQVAEFALKTRSLSSKDAKQFGLPSVISNQILRKYSKNKKAKFVKSAKLTIPNQGIKFKDQKITITSLKLDLIFDKNVEKINQIELDNEYAYICCTVKDEESMISKGYLGIDRNATGHIAVVALDNKIIKLGKKAPHIHRTFQAQRKRLQKKGKLKFIKKIKNKEARITKEINHKISRQIVDIAKENNYGIKLEDLTGIRNKKQGKNLNRIKSNWSFYQLQQFIEYKAKLLGVEVLYVDPAFTSQRCSKCGLIGERLGKKFKCPSCGHVDHADANAAFNIASSAPLLSNDHLHTDRVVCKSISDNARKEDVVSWSNNDVPI